MSKPLQIICVIIIGASLWFYNGIGSNPNSVKSSNLGPTTAQSLYEVFVPAGKESDEFKSKDLISVTFTTSCMWKLYSIDPFTHKRIVGEWQPYPKSGIDLPANAVGVQVFSESEIVKVKLKK